jgi:hypothetical protein
VVLFLQLIQHTCANELWFQGRHRNPRGTKGTGSRKKWGLGEALDCGERVRRMELRTKVVLSREVSDGCACSIPIVGVAVVYRDGGEPGSLKTGFAVCEERRAQSGE